MDVYLERGAKRVFASAVDWPGYARIGRSDDEAIETLLSYGDRYAAAVASARRGFSAPKSVTVTERVKGGSGTDFGALSVSPKVDDRPVDAKEFKRQVALLKAAWRTFDDMAKRHARKALSTGPRGGGRTIAKMTEHVRDADIAYLSSIGAKYAGTDMDELRAAFLGRLERHWKGEPIENKRRTPAWTVRSSCGARRGTPSTMRGRSRTARASSSSVSPQLSARGAGSSRSRSSGSTR